ncbi:hypothetical protein HK102_008401, partial [Quaeritorhiza haematococci]
QMDLVKVFTAGNKEWNITVKGTHKDPLFRATDIGMVLEIKNIYTSMQNFTEAKHWVLQKVKTPGGEQNVKFFTKTGLFKIMMRSRTAFAERFQDWVAEVITEIQETGQYQLQKQVDETKAKLIAFQEEKAAIETRAEEERKRAEEAEAARKEAEAKATTEQKRREELEAKMKADEFEALVARETLYVMQERSEADKRVHKVGFTKNSEGSGKRKKSFLTSHASGVDILYERKVFNAPLVERDVHSILNRYRQQRGEFFACDLQHTTNMIDFTAAVSDTLHGCHESISREDMGEKLNAAIDLEIARKRTKVNPTNTAAITSTNPGDTFKAWLNASVTYSPGHIEWVSKISCAFEAHCRAKGLVDCECPGLKALADHGLSTAKWVNVCKSCKQIARGGGNQCCPQYSMQNRTKKNVVFNVKLEHI